MYLGESYEIVLPQWDSEKSPVEIPYDLVVLGSNGIERRHGWFNPATKRITQTG